MKKILILGASCYEIIIIEHARNLGYYTIVTDNRNELSVVPAKSIADEAWNISWTDIDSLEKKCVEEGVCGVIAGFSEFRVESMIKLSSNLSMPCWLTLEQLDITRNKRKFKDLCLKLDIPCVHEYAFSDVKKYPVIIKPVDRGGSIGINVAYDSVEFQKYYDLALSLSESREVIIEDFIDDGIKFDAYFLIQNGVSQLIATNDTIMCDKKKGAEVLQKAWLFPSKFEDEFMLKLNSKFQSLFEEIRLKDGYVTISCFYCKGEFYVFETGFRLSGELSFNFYKAITGFDYLDYLIEYSMGNHRSYVLPKSFSNKGKSIVINYFGKDGVIEKIEGQNEIKRLKEVLSFMLFYKPGDKIYNNTSVLQKIAMCTIYSEDVIQLKKIVKLINSNFKVSDKDNKDLIYERVDVDSLI